MNQRDSQPEQPQKRVSAAVERGLDLCRHSVAPIVSLAQVVDELHADPTWTPPEVRQVESALRKILARIVSRREPRHWRGRNRNE